MCNDCELYVVNLSDSGEVVEPELGDKMQHCNSRTGYEMIIHGYQPDECTECNLIREVCLYS